MTPVKIVLTILGSVLLLAIGSVSAGLATNTPPSDKITICHGAGQEGTTHFITLELPYPAVYGPGGHFNENGTPQAGHEQDYLGACNSEEEPPTTTETTPTTTTPTTTTPTTPTPTTPEGPKCTPTGAGLDGNVPPSGNTNDNCEPLEPPVVKTTDPVLCVPTTVEVVRTVTVPGPTKVVTKTKTKIKWKTKYIIKTRTIVKTKIVYVKGVHKNGVEANG